MILFSFSITKRLFALILCFSLMANSQTVNFAHASNSLGGPTFSNPNILLSMPQAWHRQPIRHTQDARTAHLAITLDRQIYSVLLPIIQHYAQQQKINILVREGTCGTSANALIRKTVDMAGFCCPPGASDRLPGVQFYTLGIAAIAILVHPNNPIHNLSLSQVQNIFRGRHFLWSELETTPSKNRVQRPIQTVGRMHCKLRPGHWRKLLDNPDLFSPRMAEVDAVEETFHHLTNNTNAIGFETLWNIIRFEKQKKLKPLALDGYLPQDGPALITLRYPLYRVFSLAIWEGDSPEKKSTRKLVNYLTQAVDSLDKKMGLVSAMRLHRAGWQFQGAELVGEPTPRSPNQLIHLKNRQ